MPPFDANPHIAASASRWGPHPRHLVPRRNDGVRLDARATVGRSTVAGTLTTVAGPPLAAAIATPQNTPVSGVLQATDIDGDPLPYAIVASPTKGTITFDSTTGACTYTPLAGVTGVDTFTFNASEAGSIPTSSR